jgi:LacI family transcriptional regulator
VRPELRERVIAAARELGYHPHAAARALRRSQTSVLGMLLPPLLNPAYALIVRGAFGRAAEREFTLLLAEDLEEQHAEETFAQLVLTGRIDGLIVGSARPGHPLIARLDEYGLPHVFVNRAVQGSGRNVVMNDEHGVDVALDHLYAFGHRAIAHAGGPGNLDPARRRTDAFRRWHERRGLDPHRIVEGDFLESGGAAATAEILRRWPDTTAIYTSSASQGIGAIHAAWELGLAVPGRLSIIAAADMPLLAYLVPPLSAVAMPLFELGVAAVDALIAQIERPAPTAGAPTPGNFVIETRPLLVARGSTGHAPKQP